MGGGVGPRQRQRPGSPALSELVGRGDAIELPSTALLDLTMRRRRELAMMPLVALNPLGNGRLFPNENSVLRRVTAIQTYPDTQRVTD